jgi:hypothetical protein
MAYWSEPEILLMGAALAGLGYALIPADPNRAHACGCSCAEIPDAIAYVDALGWVDLKRARHRDQPGGIGLGGKRSDPVTISSTLILWRRSSASA